MGSRVEGLGLGGFQRRCVGKSCPVWDNTLDLQACTRMKTVRDVKNSSEGVVVD